MIIKTNRVDKIQRQAKSVERQNSVYDSMKIVNFEVLCLDYNATQPDIICLSVKVTADTAH